MQKNVTCTQCVPVDTAEQEPSTIYTMAQTMKGGMPYAREIKRTKKLLAQQFSAFSSRLCYCITKQLSLTVAYPSSFVN